ncbi:hypothetical protein PM082_023233 [Marasmius tenuissimus]|nr:hypothetical protein PM082_023233 [Marasmius tenuissimus]
MAENPPRNSLEKHLMASLLYRLYTSLVQNTQSYMKAAHQMRQPPTSTSHFISHLTPSPHSSTYRTPLATSLEDVAKQSRTPTSPTPCDS